MQMSHKTLLKSFLILSDKFSIDVLCTYESDLCSLFRFKFQNPTCPYHSDSAILNLIKENYTMFKLLVLYKCNFLTPQYFLVFTSRTNTFRHYFLLTFFPLLLKKEEKKILFFNIFLANCLMFKEWQLDNVDNTQHTLANMDCI